MHVALLVRRFPVVSETFVVNEARWFLDHGHAVHIVPEHPVDSPVPVPDDILARFVREPRLPSPRPRNVPRLAADITRTWLRHRSRLGRAVDFRNADRKNALLALYWLIRLQRIGSVDAVHAHFGPSALFAARLQQAGLLSSPIVATFHGQDLTARPHKRNDLAMYQPVFDQAVVMTVGSEFMKGKLAELGAPTERIVVLPQAVDTTAFSPPREPRRTNGPLVVLSVGRLTEVKGFAHALHAVARATHHVTDLRYVVVGDGPLRADLAATAAELGISDLVDFRGSLDHAGVAAAYREADVVLLSGVRTADGQEEGQGLVPLEAAATGVPVIASRSGGLAETVADGVTGLLVPPGDVAALSDALVELCADRDRRLAMGAAGRARVIAHYSLDAHMGKLFRLVTDAVAGTASGVRTSA